MKQSLLAFVLVLNLIGCAAEVPPAPPEPQQPAQTNKWGDKFEPAVKYCGQYYASSDPQNATKWEAVCRCIYTAAAARWEYNDYYNNGVQYDQQLSQEQIPQNCMKSAGINF